ncbi:hypothetical protein D3C76_1391940 [compost metagenome]
MASSSGAAPVKVTRSEVAIIRIPAISSARCLPVVERAMVIVISYLELRLKDTHFQEG